MKATTKPATRKSGKTPGAGKSPPKGKKKGPTRERRLTVQQERFCERIAAGDNQTEAYMKAGYKAPRLDARKHAATLMTKHGIESRIAELRKPETTAAKLTKEEKLAWLARIVRTPIGHLDADSDLVTEITEDTIGGGSQGRLRRGSHPSGNETVSPTVIRRRIKIADKLRALELHSKLTGDFEPEKQQIDHRVSNLDEIRKRARDARSPFARNVAE